MHDIPKPLYRNPSGSLSALLRQIAHSAGVADDLVHRQRESLVDWIDQRHDESAAQALGACKSRLLDGSGR